MFDLTNFTVADMSACGLALRKLGEGATSMEQVANRIVRYLYESFIDGATGVKSCALVRFYKTHAFGDLEADDREFARRVLGSHPESPSMRCLTLLATVGEKPEWNSRANSSSHRAIPLPSETVVAQFPMVSQLINQLGLEVSSVLKPDPDLMVELEKKAYNVFYIPEAVGSQYVPAQEEFVVPFGIRSVLGLGGMLPTGNLFAVIMFTKVPITVAVSRLFRVIPMLIKMAVLPFDGVAVFDRR